MKKRSTEKTLAIPSAPPSFDEIAALIATPSTPPWLAKIAANSTGLSTPTGRTKSGRGKALPPGAYGPKTFCAVVIAEAWKFFNGEYPAPRNRGAAEAAQAYWLVSGGPTNGWGADPLEAWRPHFQKARGPETAKERAECLRHLELHRQFGEPGR